MGAPIQLEIFIQSIKYTVDRLKNLKVILVYSSSPDREKVCEIFKYAIEAGIEVQIPDNMLQTRNRLKGGDSDGSNNNSGEGHGTIGSPRETTEELFYPAQAEANENGGSGERHPVYDPSPKHDKGGWGSSNPIKTQEEGQRLLDSGYHDGKQVYNVTDSGTIVKFQPDNTPNNGYHSYELSKPRNIPASILKQMLNDGKISKAEYTKIRKGKK